MELKAMPTLALLALGLGIIGLLSVVLYLVSEVHRGRR